jgi:hypothetical protein
MTAVFLAMVVLTRLAAPLLIIGIGLGVEGLMYDS